MFRLCLDVLFEHDVAEEVLCCQVVLDEEDHEHDHYLDRLLIEVRELELVCFALLSFGGVGCWILGSHHLVWSLYGPWQFVSFFIRVLSTTR